MNERSCIEGFDLTEETMYVFLFTYRLGVLYKRSCIDVTEI